MAAKDQEREYDFVEQPPEEFFCLVSLAVLLEPYQTQCCGNHLSQEAEGSDTPEISYVSMEILHEILKSCLKS